MILPVITYPNLILAQCAEPIDVVRPEHIALGQNMLETMYSKEGIGLAAPQVGCSERLIVVDVSGPDQRNDPRILLNPVIVATNGHAESNEGCLSVVNYRAKVQRAEKISVQALNIDGQDIEFEAEGMLAICLQHEIDHLNGVLFIDRISRLKRSLYEQKLKKWIKHPPASQK